MKMMEDLAEVMKRVNRTDCEEYALRYVEFFDEHGATIRDMAARLEAAERDAARYRWLRSKNVGDGRLYEVIHDDCQPGYKGMKFEEGLDAAIDTAMQETER